LATRFDGTLLKIVNILSIVVAKVGVLSDTVEGGDWEIAHLVLARHCPAVIR
jgi:hypothetical protein